MSENASERCKEIVYSGVWSRGSRCASKAKKDGYCMRHHPESVAKRRADSELAFQQKREKDPLLLAHNRIAELTKQRDELLAALKGLVECISETRGSDAERALFYAKLAIEKASQP